jgi:hypothetical protein
VTTWWRTKRRKTSPEAEFYAELLRAVGRLALAPEAQIAYLSSIGTAPSADELGLEFHESLTCVDLIRARGWLTALEASMLEVLDTKLERMCRPGRESLWDVEALSTADEWKEIRQRAQEFLFLSFGLPRGDVVRVPAGDY